MKPIQSPSEMSLSDRKRNQRNTSTPNPQPDTPQPEEQKPPLEFPADQRPGLPNEKTPTQAKNEGEGNRTADRAYREGATKFAKSGQVHARAQEAARAVDGLEGPELRKAEEQARNVGKT